MLFNTEKANLFKAQSLKVKNMIDALERAGFSSKEHRFALDKINEDILSQEKNIEEKYKNGEAFSDDLLVINYDEGIKKLNLLQEELLSLDIYYKCSNFVSSVLLKLNKQISYNELKEIEREAINLLDDINTKNVSMYDLKKDTIESLYDVLYNLIMIEYKRYSENKLATAIKENEMAYNYLNELIRKKAYADGSNSMISVLKEKEAKQGLLTDYLDKNIIKILASKKTEEELEDLYNKLQETAEKLLENEKNLVELDSDKEKFEKEIETERKKKQKITFASIIHTFIACGLIVGSISLGIFVGNKCYKENLYNTKRMYYSTDESLNGKVIEQHESYLNDQMITVTDYEPYKQNGNGNYHRTYYKYSYNKDNVENIADLLTADYSKDSLYKHEESSTKLDASDIYDELLRIVEVIEQEDEIADIKLHPYKAWFFGILTVVGGLFISLILEVGLDDLTTYSIFESLDEIEEAIVDARRFNKLKKEDLKKIKDGLTKQKEILKNSEFLSDEFMLKYNTYMENAKEYEQKNDVVSLTRAKDIASKYSNF